MRRLVREHDWASTPLGPIERWPEGLRTAVDMVLGAGFPQMVLWGPELVQIYNDQYARLAGPKHPAALGQPLREFWRVLWAKNGPLFERAWVGETVQLENARYEFTLDGERTEERYYTSSYSPIHGAEGQVVGLLVTLVETTLAVRTQEMQVERERLLRELGASEQRLREVFDQAPVAVAVMEGPEHVYTIVSPRYAQTPGGGRPLLGRSVAEAFPELEGQGFVETMDRVYRTGTPFFANERLVKLDRDGDGVTEDYWFNVGYQPLRDASGSVYAIASVAYDVTEQMHARRELELAQEAAEQARVEAVTANQAKSAFLTTMSHELRTPLNAVAGYADLLLMGVRGSLNDDQRTDLERIKRSGQYLLGLINDVLNFAKLDSGQVEYRFETVEVAPLLEGLEDLIRPQLDAKGVHYEHHAEDRSLTVRADPEKLRQILLNLLANAVKFTQPGGRVRLSCSSTEEQVRMTVSDTGRGIAADQLRRVFDPFVQVERHLTPMSQQGVGLGLAISRDLANGMGGSLEATSELGVGSEFSVVLPRGF